MLIQKGFEEDTWQVSASFYDRIGRWRDHLCKGWFQAIDETEIIMEQLRIVRIIESENGPSQPIVVALQGAKGYRPKKLITVSQLEKELTELI